MRPTELLPRAWITAAVVACLACGCATYHNPLTGEEEQTLYGTRDEIALGRQVSAEIEKKLELSDDQAQGDLVKRLGRKVAAVSDRPDLPYQFKVIKAKEVNAFAIPGGFIYVHSGLVEAVNEAELSAVLAHEVGHVVARHGIKKMEASFGYGLATLVAVAIWGEEEVADVTQFSDDALALVLMGYGRRDELQADQLAITYTAKAGYDPRAMITMLEKLKQAQKGAEPIPFLSTHPPIDLRIQEARARVIERMGPQ